MRSSGIFCHVTLDPEQLAPADIPVGSIIISTDIPGPVNTFTVTEANGWPIQTESVGPDHAGHQFTESEIREGVAEETVTIVPPDEAATGMIGRIESGLNLTHDPGCGQRLTTNRELLRLYANAMAEVVKGQFINQALGTPIPVWTAIKILYEAERFDPIRRPSEWFDSLEYQGYHDHLNDPPSKVMQEIEDGALVCTKCGQSVRERV